MYNAIYFVLFLKLLIIFLDFNDAVLNSEVA